jgi:hypothetical protein
VKLPLVLTRIMNTTRELRAGCMACHRERPRWTGPNAQALAAQHHDRTGHPTWCDIAMQVRYGRPPADDRQIDIEDAIASASSGGAPECAPLPVLDASAAVTADVSVPVGRPVEALRFNARAARGRKPETAS